MGNDRQAYYTISQAASGSEIEEMLDNLVLNPRGRSPKLIAGNFNAWTFE